MRHPCMENETLVIHCIRHGQSVANAGGASSDTASIPLTELGLEQARAVRERLKNASPDLFICSPHVRARQTAEPTLQSFPSVPVETWPIEEFSLLAHRWANTTKEQRRPWVQEYWNRADPHFIDGEGAESFAGFIARVRDALSNFEALHQKSCRSVIAFGHGQFFLAIRWLILKRTGDITPEAMRDFHDSFKTDPIANGSGFSAVFNGHGWAVMPETT